jgi:CYTH domain-containing protein
MGVEIERKFLVNADKWATENKDDKKLIEQGYILNDGEKTVRVRFMATKGLLR